MVEAEWLGRMAFDHALALQEAQREAVVAGAPGRVFLVEHPPSLTLGRRGVRADVLWSDDELVRRGVGVFETPRGGQVTLHAPGQLVVYPVVHVGRRIREHVHTLAEVTMRLLAELGITGMRFRDDQPGVWIGGEAPREAKIASIGVHISRGVAIQGLSLNLAVERSLFGALVSCGLPEVELTSASDRGARPIAMPDAARRWAELFADARGESLRWVESVRAR